MTTMTTMKTMKTMTMTARMTMRMAFFIAICDCMTTITAFQSLSVIPTSRRYRVPSSLNVVGPETYLALVQEGDTSQITKSVVIGLVFGGGLIPAAINGNKEMINTLTGKRPLQQDAGDPKTSLDPTIAETKYRTYIEDSGASGPLLPAASILFSQEPIKLVDIIAIMGRIQDVNSLCDWKNLPSAKRDNVSLTNPPLWLPRAAFKVNIRKSKQWYGWPLDATTGEPIGGVALQKAEEGRIQRQGALIGDAALDAVWDTWAWGASIGTPDKVMKQLRNYHPTPRELNVNNLVSAILFGRSLTGLAALTFVVIQVVAYGALFVGPLLRTFADVDIGFGGLGMCDPDTCVKLFS